MTRWIAVYLGTHCNIGSKTACWPFASDQKLLEQAILCAKTLLMHTNESYETSDLNKVLQVSIPYIITYANCGDDWLRHLEVVWGQILPFPMGFRRRSYNSVALPCEGAIDYHVIKRDLAIRSLDWYFTSTITQFNFIILCTLCFIKKTWQ